MKTFSQHHTEYDLILRELWNDEVRRDEGLTANDGDRYVGSANIRMARHNLLERARREGWAECRYSGVRGGRRYHAVAS
jgi:hypothetical protein